MLSKTTFKINRQRPQFPETERKPQHSIRKPDSLSLSSCSPLTPPFLKRLSPPFVECFELSQSCMILSCWCYVKLTSYGDPCRIKAAFIFLRSDFHPRSRSPVSIKKIKIGKQWIKKNAMKLSSLKPKIEDEKNGNRNKTKNKRRTLANHKTSNQSLNPNLDTEVVQSNSNLNLILSPFLSIPT